SFSRIRDDFGVRYMAWPLRFNWWVHTLPAGCKCLRLWLTGTVDVLPPSSFRSSEQKIDLTGHQSRHHLQCGLLIINLYFFDNYSQFFRPYATIDQGPHLNGHNSP